MPRKTNFNVNGIDYFRVTKTIGKDASGQPVRKAFYGGFKMEAEAKRDEYLAGIKQGLSAGYDKVTFGVAFKHWFENVHRHKISLSSYKRYEVVYRLYIANSGLVGMRLIDVKATNIQSWYNDLLNLTSATNIRSVNKLLKIFFFYCIKADILIKNPLLAVELPKAPTQTSTNTALTDTDIEKLIAACKEDIRHFPYVFICFSGLRAGELLALTYKDIDFKEGLISVNKSVKYLHVEGEYKPVISDTKTAASIRRVPILNEIQGLLQAHINHVRHVNRIFTIDGDFLLFPSETGTYRDSGNFLKTFKRLCVQLDIEKGRTIHSLRHTYATILARQGVSLLDASRLMGHANINTTAAIYSHVTETDKINAVKKLAGYFTAENF